MTDTVTVSDRMRKLVEDYAQKVRPRPTRLNAYEAEETLLREIGWLETVINQNDKRIQKLEFLVARAQDAAAAAEVILIAFGITRDASDVWWKGNVSAETVQEAITLFASPDPAGKTPSTKKTNVSGSLGRECGICGRHFDTIGNLCDDCSTPISAKPIPPQTRGEAIPVSTASFNEGKFSDRPIRLTGSSALIVELDVERQKLAALEAENARLLTALEERDFTIELLKGRRKELVQQVAALQSAAVVQKGELERAHGTIVELTKLRAGELAAKKYQSPTSGA